MRKSDRFGPNEYPQLLFQGTTFDIAQPARFLPYSTEPVKPGRFLVLEDTKGAYYLIPLDALQAFRLPAKSIDALERSLGGDTAGYGHFNPHADPIFNSRDDFHRAVDGRLGEFLQFYQGGLFKLPASLLKDRAGSDDDVRLVVRDTDGVFYVVPLDLLRAHIVPREMKAALDEAVGVRPPHETW